MFSDAGCAAIFGENDLWWILALLNTKYAQDVFDIINPTINYTQNTIANLPCATPDDYISVNQTSKENVELCKNDWDSFETSWDFKRHPLV